MKMMLKPTLLLAWLTTLCVGGSTTQVTARRLASDAMALTMDATPATAAACRSARQQAVHALHDSHNDLRELLDDCTKRLLYMGFKWIDADQARAYCNADACRTLVARLHEFPKCTWENLPSDSDGELLAAQRVLTDCTE